MQLVVNAGAVALNILHHRNVTEVHGGSGGTGCPWARTWDVWSCSNFNSESMNGILAEHQWPVKNFNLSRGPSGHGSLETLWGRLYPRRQPHDNQSLTRPPRAVSQLNISDKHFRVLAAPFRLLEESKHNLPLLPPKHSFSSLALRRHGTSRLRQHL